MPRGGHIRLTGEECDEKDQIIAGKSFMVRYLGSIKIHSENGREKGCTNEAVRDIYARYNTKRTINSLDKRQLFISANCVSLYASIEDVVVFKFSTVDITFCNTSDESRNAFAFVVWDTKLGAFHAHVIHCDYPAQANDICLAMHEAFTVRSALYQAKRVDRAGWANGLLSSQQKNEKRIIETTNENKFHNAMQKNGAHDETDSNNNFGEFACAVVVPCKNDICRESENNSDVNNASVARYPKQLLTADNVERWTEGKAYAQNGGSFSLTKMLLNGGINRNRSQSLPFVQNTWDASNGEWGSYQSSGDDEFDDFSMLARERSSSMKLLTAE